jgi:serine/threonine protein kinase
MENLTGKQLGQYQIIESLGEGGMAAVYKAYQLGKLNRYVALKILPPLLAKSPEFAKRFEQEAKILAELQHPHIVPVFDFGEDEGYYYLVMPFIEGCTLADLLHGKPLPLSQIRRITVQVAEALDYAHSRGLVHRDVKPSNILVDGSGNCLLSDFGITKILESAEKLTSTGEIVGTPAYMSPEQGRGEPLDGRSDIYSLGAVLYEMATGRVPYRADTPLAVIIKHMQDPLPPPRSINPYLPIAVEQVILKALAKRKEDRYQTAGEMARAIQAAIPEAATFSDQTEIANVFQLEDKTPTKPSMLITKKTKTGLPKRILALSGMAIIAISIVAVVIGSSVRLGIKNSTTGTPTAAVEQAVDSGITAAVSSSTTIAPFSPLTTSTTTAKILFFEDFTTNRIKGKYYVDVVGPWKVEDGKYLIELSGPDLPWAATFIYPLSRDVREWTDYSVETDLMCEENDVEFFAGVGLRQGSEGTTSLELHWNANYVALSRTTEKQEYHILKSEEFELEFAKWYHLKLTAIGNHLWAYIDNRVVIDFTDRDTRQYYGGVPLGVYGGGRIRCAFDNVKIEAVTP